MPSARIKFPYFSKQNTKEAKPAWKKRSKHSAPASIPQGMFVESSTTCQKGKVRSRCRRQTAAAQATARWCRCTAAAIMERESRNTSPAWASAVALRTRQRWTSIQPSGGVQSGTLLWEGIQMQTVPWINKPLIRCQKSGKSPSQRPVLMPRWSRRTKAWLSIKSITGLLAAEEAKQACRRAARSPAAGVCSKPVTAPWTVVPESVETAQLALWPSITGSSYDTTAVQTQGGSLKRIELLNKSNQSRICYHVGKRQHRRSIHKWNQQTTFSSAPELTIPWLRLAVKSEMLSIRRPQSTFTTQSRTKALCDPAIHCSTSQNPATVVIHA